MRARTYCWFDRIVPLRRPLVVAQRQWCIPNSTHSWRLRVVTRGARVRLPCILSVRCSTSGQTYTHTHTHTHTAAGSLPTFQLPTHPFSEKSSSFTTIPSLLSSALTTEDKLFLYPTVTPFSSAIPPTPLPSVSLCSTACRCLTLPPLENVFAFQCPSSPSPVFTTGERAYSLLSCSTQMIFFQCEQKKLIDQRDALTSKKNRHQKLCPACFRYGFIRFAQRFTRPSGKCVIQPNTRTPTNAAYNISSSSLTSCSFSDSDRLCAPPPTHTFRHPPPPPPPPNQR